MRYTESGENRFTAAVKLKLRRTDSQLLNSLLLFINQSKACDQLYPATVSRSFFKNLTTGNWSIEKLTDVENP